MAADQGDAIVWTDGAANLSKVARSRPETTAVVTPSRRGRITQRLESTVHGTGGERVSDQRGERAVEVDGDEHLEAGSEGAERGTQVLAHLAHCAIRL